MRYNCLAKVSNFGGNNVKFMLSSHVILLFFVGFFFLFFRLPLCLVLQLKLLLDLIMGRVVSN